MEGAYFSNFGSRLSAAHIRLQNIQQVQGWRVVGFQNVTLALAPRTFVLKFPTVTGMEGGSLSKCGSRLSAAHIRDHVKRNVHKPSAKKNHARANMSNPYQTQ